MTRRKPQQHYHGKTKHPYVCCTVKELYDKGLIIEISNQPISGTMFQSKQRNQRLNIFSHPFKRSLFCRSKKKRITTMKLICDKASDARHDKSLRIQVVKSM